MHEHESTPDSPNAGDLERSMTPAGPVPPTSDADGSTAEPHPDRPLFRGMPVNLAALSFSKFRRRSKVDAEPATPDKPNEAKPAPSGWFSRLAAFDWGRLPLANARRETRVGVAALLSFVVLVTAMILNRSHGDAKKSPPLALSRPVGEVPRNLDTAAVKKAARKPKIRADPPTPEVDPTATTGTEPREGFQLASNDTPPRPTEPPPPAKADPPDAGKAVPAAPPKVEPAEEPAKVEPVAPPKVEAVEPKLDPAAPKANPAAPPTVEPAPLPKSESLLPPKSDPPPIVPEPEPKTDPTPPPIETAPQKPLDLIPIGAEPNAPIAPDPKLAAPLPAPDPKLTTPHAPDMKPPAVVAPVAPPVDLKPRTNTDPPPIEASPEAVPVPTSRMPEFAPAPTAVEANPAPTPATAPPDGSTIRNLGKQRPAESESEAETKPHAAEPIADAPMPREAAGARERVEPVLHTVRSGENFWTISKLYYDSGRYYKSLHSANRKLVPNIRELYVGTTIKVPPIEDLDPTLIERPARASSGASRASQSPDEPRTPPAKRRTNVELDLPTVGASRVGDRAGDVEEPSQPTYKVRRYDTLRGIARDTLGDPRRYREILEMNRDVIDDPAHLTVGQNLTLPEDATVGRRMR